MKTTLGNSLHGSLALRRTASWAGLVAAALGASVLAGWMFDIPSLKSVVPGFVTMKANTALGMFLCGVALAILSREKIAPPARFWMAGVAAMMAALGALTLSEYLFDWELGLDQLLFRDVVDSAATSSPGRMAPSSAFGFVLMGCALWVGSRPLARRVKLPVLEAMGAAIIVIGAFALSGYMLDALFGFRWWSYTGMAVHTAAGFILLGGGMLAFARSEGGLRWSLSAPVTGGLVLGVASLLAAAGASYYFVSQLRQSAAWVNHTQEALKKIGEISGNVANLGSNQRSYVNTGNESLLKQDAEMKDAIRKVLDDFRALTADDPQQQERAGRLDRLIARRMEWGEQTVEARRKDGLSAAERLIANGSGIALSDSIRRLTDEMEEHEYSLLAQRQKKEVAISSTTFLLLPLGVFLSIALLSVGLFFLNAGVAERARSEAKARWLATFPERNPNPIVEVDPAAGVIHYMNSSAARLFPDLQRQGLRHPWLAGLTATAGTLHERNGETERREIAAGGLFFAQTINYIPETKRLRVYGADISERKRAEAAVAQLAAIVEFSEDAIIGKDLNGAITSWNAGSERLFGYTAAEMVGRPVTQLIPAARQQEETEILRSIRRGESVTHFDTERLRKDGSIVPISVTVSPIKDSTGRIVGASKVARDITERLRVQKVLRESHENLERKVAERTAELQLAKESAEAAGKAKSEFLASMSHELRTPLNGIIGFSEFLVDGKPGALNLKQKEYLEDILRSGRHLLQLINDVLDLAKVESGKIELLPERFPLRKAVEEVCSVAGPMAHKKQIHVRLSVAPGLVDVTLDQMRFKQVVYNLLSNALKFTDSGGRVEIDCAPHGLHQFKLAVKDSGIGIKPEDHERLFKEFEQIESGLARRFEGTGLGLALTRKIVELQSGCISVSSEVGVGSVFTVILPRAFGKEVA